jgi:long-chain fatty acid transport protein
LKKIQQQWMLKGLFGFGVIAAGGLVSPWAAATDGYFAHGYGMKSIGMGGASVARTDDAFGGANNPAQMVFAGDRLDVGLSLFSPSRGAERTGATISSLDGNVDSGMKDFFIPEFAFNRLVSPDLSLGVSVYGNGGMNTHYHPGNFGCPNPQTGTFFSGNMLCGQSNLGVDLMQLVIAPTAAYKLAPEHSIGVSPLITIQRFKVEGLQYFGPFSNDPNSLTNHGYDWSRGIGVRIGYLGQLSPLVSVGAQYATRTYMSKFSKYRGLFAEQGGFDLPSNFTVGAQLRPAPGWTVAVDYERILYGDVRSIGDSSSLLLQCAPGRGGPTCLGGNNAGGFGWQSVNAYKVGVEYVFNPALTLRAGYNHSESPIRAQDVTPNIIAPGVVQDHFTLGLTLPLGGHGSEVTAAGMYAPSKSVTGPSLFNPIFQGLAGIPNAGGTERIHLSEFLVGLAWGTKF